MRRTGGTLLGVHQITEQRQNADDNDNRAHDLPGTPVNRQHIDQDERNKDKCGERPDEDIHVNPRVTLQETALTRPCKRAITL
jgi:hypothetical protein